jgi:cbb3-type cytochrome oxidase subunit 1
MDWFAKAFLKASLVWLTAGVTLGVAMAVHPAWSVYRVSHEHMNLLGFVTMMIYGVAYHVIPRFTGVPLHSRRIAGAHWWMANTGLLLMVVGFALRASGTGPIFASTAILSSGGLAAAIGAYLFVYNIWRTLDGFVVVAGSLRRAEGR